MLPLRRHPATPRSASTSSSLPASSGHPLLAPLQRHSALPFRSSCYQRQAQQQLQQQQQQQQPQHLSSGRYSGRCLAAPSAGTTCFAAPWGRGAARTPLVLTRAALPPSSDSSSSAQSNSASDDASLAAAAPPPPAAGAPAAAVTAPTSKPRWRWLPSALSGQLLLSAVQLQRTHFAPLLLLHGMRMLLTGLLHRLSHRLTNAAAEVVLGAPASLMAADQWALHMDPIFMSAYPGYQFVIGAFFILALPLTILLNTYEATAAALICTAPGAVAAAPAVAPAAAPAATAIAAVTPASPSSSASSNGTGASTSSSTAASGTPAPGAEATSPLVPSAAAAADKAPPPPQEAEVGAIRWTLQGVGHGLRTAAGVAPSVWAMLRRVWWVDLIYNARALPLQALSLAVLPVPWTVPRFLALQLALPAAILEGLSGRAALLRSREIMAGQQALYAWPWLALLLGARLVTFLRDVSFANMPGRWWAEVPEVPVVLMALFAVVKLVLSRAHDLLPLVAYMSLVGHGGGTAGKMGGTGGAASPDGSDKGLQTVLAPQS